MLDLQLPTGFESVFFYLITFTGIKSIDQLVVVESTSHFIIDNGAYLMGLEKQVE
jgi:hypothetical protein